MNKLIIMFLILSSNLIWAQLLKYQDQSLSIEERVEDLVNRMTLEEKVSQLITLRPRDKTSCTEEGTFVGDLDTSIVNHGLGSFLFMFSFPSERDIKMRVKSINDAQRQILEKSRFGIPAFIYGESLHGFMDHGATSFPQAIALGSTWDTTLVENLFSIASLEARSRGTNQVLAPVLDLARDPRWGRTEECYSEDPYLVSRMSVAAVFGLQGRKETIDTEHVVATLKHFAGHGQPEQGRNLAPVNFSEREFRANHLYPFEIVVRKANPQSMMVSYNEWDGIPNHINKKLLTDILRDEWGFKGYVVSDLGGFDLTYQNHLAADDSAESGVMSIVAGVDIDLGSNGCYKSLTDQVKKDAALEDYIDQAARRILRVKFTIGLFDHPYVDIEKVANVTNTKKHKAFALKAAHEAMVLLKNENSTLPFNADELKSLAVIGPNAKGVHLGGYSNIPSEGVDVLQGIQEFAAGRFKINYAEGCKITVNKENHWGVHEIPILNDPENDKKLIAEAVKVANESDAVVLVLGENELINREAWHENHLGDTDNLNLVGMQNELAEAIIKTGKPVVVLLFNGRPLSVNYLAENAPAIIECWYLGQETGHAVADVLFGVVNPSGKLPVTIPRSIGQLPCYYNKKPSIFRNYVLADTSPLYPFGYGLSYSNYEYKNLTITPDTITTAAVAEVSLLVTNTGKIKGDEIVQLYIHDKISLPTRPIKELRDFVRVTLNPGETKTVKFIITPDKLDAVGMDMKRVLQPGDFEIMVGKNSVDLLVKSLVVK